MDSYDIHVFFFQDIITEFQTHYDSIYILCRRLLYPADCRGLTETPNDDDDEEYVKEKKLVGLKVLSMHLLMGVYLPEEIGYDAALNNIRTWG